MSDHRAPQRASLIGRPSRRLLAVLTVLLVVAGTTWFTGASFTSGTDTSVSIGAAQDYYPPKVSVTSPGATVAGAVAVSAPASDTGSGVAQVVVEYAAAGSSTWTTLCTDTTSPYSCTWDTLTVLDGDYQLRATATDNVGTTATSAVVATKVANPTGVTWNTVNDVNRGDVVLRATVNGAGTRSVSSTFAYRLAGTTGNFTPICTGVTGTTPSCTWATGTMADTYDLRVTSVVGTGGAAVTVTADRTDVIVDNAAPTPVTLTAPSPMSGTVQVVATAVDDDSGVKQVDLAYRLAPAGTWVPLCTVTAEPYRCALDTSLLQDLTYELRAVATDVAGNQATVSITRLVSNALPTISITSPLTGDRVVGTKTITTAYVANGATVQRVVFEARLNSTGAWTQLCPADTTAPYTCDWASAGFTSGSWELRATMSYTAANAVPGSVSSTSVVTVDNSPLRALDVQATNCGTSGRPDSGDTLVLTYSGQVDLASISTNWTYASATNLSAVFADKAYAPTSATDRVTIGNLGTVAFPQNYVRKKKQVTLNATATAVYNAGANTTTITVTLGSVSGGAAGDLTAPTTTGTMTWTPSANAKSSSQVAASTAPATESGALDRDL